MVPENTHEEKTACGTENFETSRNVKGQLNMEKGSKNLRIFLSLGIGTCPTEGNWTEMVTSLAAGDFFPFSFGFRVSMFCFGAWI